MSRGTVSNLSFAAIGRREFAQNRSSPFEEISARLSTIKKAGPFKPSVSLPTGANLISSHGYDPTVQLPWSRALTKNWTAVGMFSLMWPTEAARRNLTGSFDKPGTPTWNIPAPFPNVVVRST